jgi:hypothetical protein
MDYDSDKVDEAVLALLYLTLHAGAAELGRYRAEQSSAYLAG